VATPALIFPPHIESSRDKIRCRCPGSLPIMNRVPKDQFHFRPLHRLMLANEGATLIMEGEVAQGTIAF
jgi:hypothetical protein